MNRVHIIRRIVLALSMVAAAWEKMGVTVCSLDSCSRMGNTWEKVQKEPQRAKPMFMMITSCYKERAA